MEEGGASLKRARGESEGPFAHLRADLLHLVLASLSQPQVLAARRVSRRWRRAGALHVHRIYRGIEISRRVSETFPRLADLCLEAVQVDELQEILEALGARVSHIRRFSVHLDVERNNFVDPRFFALMKKLSDLTHLSLQFCNESLDGLAIGVGENYFESLLERSCTTLEDVVIGGAIFKAPGSPFPQLPRLRRAVLNVDSDILDALNHSSCLMEFHPLLDSWSNCREEARIRFVERHPALLLVKLNDLMDVAGNQSTQALFDLHQCRICDLSNSWPGFLVNRGIEITDIGNLIEQLDEENCMSEKQLNRFRLIDWSDDVQTRTDCQMLVDFMIQCPSLDSMILFSGGDLHRFSGVEHVFRRIQRLKLVSRLEQYHFFPNLILISFHWANVGDIASAAEHCPLLEVVYFRVFPRLKAVVADQFAKMKNLRFVHLEEADADWNFSRSIIAALGRTMPNVCVCVCRDEWPCRHPWFYV